MDITLHDAIYTRQSVRRFLDTPIAEADCDSLLAAAAQAPSPHGRQPWRFVVIGTGTPRERLCDAMSSEWQSQLGNDGSDANSIAIRLAASRARITSAPLLFLPCVDLSVLDHYPDAQRQQSEYLMAVQSIGCAIQNMLLTAVALGIHSGWMCAPLFCGETVRTVFDLDAQLIPQALIPFGYMAQSPMRRPKRSGSSLRVNVNE
ncbi:MAG: nitroreductase family protein [Chloroflexales bacterium]|nr:nitroreductase family protein [Chloroflexales bacterium]